MNKPTEKSSSESQPQTASGAPTREEIELRAHTRSTSNAVALMDRMWKIGYKQNVS